MTLGQGGGPLHFARNFDLSNLRELHKQAMHLIPTHTQREENRDATET